MTKAISKLKKKKEDFLIYKWAATKIYKAHHS